MKKNINHDFYDEYHKKLIYNNPEKQKIARDMLERYTGTDASEFKEYIILTNFFNYLKMFSSTYNSKIIDGTVLSVVHSNDVNISMVDINIGAPTAALIIEILSVIRPKAVLFLGMCGGLNSVLNVGDFLIPIAAIRDEGVSSHFIPPQVPSLPTFEIQKLTSQIIIENGLDYHTGVVHTTDVRFWEFDEMFKRVLYEERAVAIDMECSALFSVGFVCKVPIGALLLVSDLPLVDGGIKTKESSKKVFQDFTNKHIELGIETMIQIQKRGEHIRYYRW